MLRYAVFRQTLAHDLQARGRPWAVGDRRFAGFPGQADAGDVVVAVDSSRFAVGTSGTREMRRPCLSTVDSHRNCNAAESTCDAKRSMLDWMGDAEGSTSLAISR
jgi:hypothetical protein